MIVSLGRVKLVSLGHVMLVSLGHVMLVSLGHVMIVSLGRAKLGYFVAYVLDVSSRPLNSLSLYCLLKMIN